MNNTNVYGAQQPNFTIELLFHGIAGLKTFQVFSIKNFPRPYSDKEVLFQIVDVTHVVTNNVWETRVKAAIRPIRNYNATRILYTEDGINSYTSPISSR